FAQAPAAPTTDVVMIVNHSEPVTGGSATPFAFTDFAPVVQGAGGPGCAVAEQFVNFGFRASHNGQPQPSALWWRWQRRDGRYWVQGQWRSYAAGQAPFVQVGSGILEGSPAAPPDAFAAL